MPRYVASASVSSTGHGVCASCRARRACAGAHRCCLAARSSASPLSSDAHRVRPTLAMAAAEGSGTRGGKGHGARISSAGKSSVVVSSPVVKL